MIERFRMNGARNGGIALAMVLALGASACSRVRTHQGFIIDTQLVDAIQPGVDNRDSVEKTLGRPTFAAQFSQGDWYYVQRESKQLAFADPKPVSQLVVRVRFDQAGNVAAVDKAGLDRISKIRPSGDKTPTLGKNRGFFEELFGNIGQVGSVGQSGGTADNPDGGN
jgi:outer membrane protein assembly factor BamE (lipoprotein component of BamABCDE complex)